MNSRTHSIMERFNDITRTRRWRARSTPLFVLLSLERVLISTYDVKYRYTKHDASHHHRACIPSRARAFFDLHRRRRVPSTSLSRVARARALDGHFLFLSRPRARVVLVIIVLSFGRAIARTRTAVRVSVRLPMMTSRRRRRPAHDESPRTSLAIETTSNAS